MSNLRFGLSLLWLAASSSASTPSLAFEPPLICPSTPVRNERFEKSQEKAQTLLRQFANHRLVASEADQTLSKLISTKSPAFMEWYEKRGLQNQSEDEVVRQWREYYAKMFKISRYPKGSDETNLLIEKLIEETYASALPEKERKHLQTLFLQAKEAALKTVQGFQISKDAKDSILARLKPIELNFLSKLRESAFAKNPLEAISWGIAYDPIPNQINIGVEALKYPNDQTLFAVFTHELGHAFDSCRWSALLKGSFPFSRVVSCLRKPESVAAATRDDSRLDEFLGAGKITSEIHASLRANPTCNKLEYPPIGMQSDQSLEAFADWFSAEVVSASKYAQIGVRRDLCEKKDLNPGSAYPSNDSRLMRIYFANPALRKKAGQLQPPPAQYCPL